MATVAGHEGTECRSIEDARGGAIAEDAAEDSPRFLSMRGSRIGGQHKDKKQRITEALSDLQLTIAGAASRGEGPREMSEIAQTAGSLARACSMFLRKMLLGHARQRDARLLDDGVLDSLETRLQPVRKIPIKQRRMVETGFHLDRVGIRLVRKDEASGKPLTQHGAVGGPQGLRIRVEWPLPGMTDWVAAPSASRLWKVSADQLIDTNSERAMRCDDWLGQQLVMFDGQGISLEKVIRTVANLEGAHATSVGRLAVAEGEIPSKASKEPHIHILRNITLFGVGYVDLVVIEIALHLYWSLLGETSIERPSGEIALPTLAFECPPEQVTSVRPSWLGFRGVTMVSFSPNPGVVRHIVRGPR